MLLVLKKTFYPQEYKFICKKMKLSKQILIYPTQTTFFQLQEWKITVFYLEMYKAGPRPHPLPPPRFSFISPKSKPPCCCAHHEQSQGATCYTQGLSIQAVQPNSLPKCFSGQGFWVFFRGVLTGAQLGRNVSLNLENTSPAQVHNSLYITYQFCNWMGSLGGWGLYCAAGAVRARCRWGPDSFQQLLPLCTQISQQPLRCFVCTFLVLNYKKKNPPSCVCLSIFFFNVSFPAVFSSKYLPPLLFFQCVYPSVSFMCTEQFCFLLTFFPLLSSPAAFSALPSSPSHFLLTTLWPSPGLSPPPMHRMLHGNRHRGREEQRWVLGKTCWPVSNLWVNSELAVKNTSHLQAPAGGCSYWLAFVTWVYHVCWMGKALQKAMSGPMDRYSPRLASLVLCSWGQFGVDHGWRGSAEVHGEVFHLWGGEESVREAERRGGEDGELSLQDSISLASFRSMPGRG